jgi:polyhydroxybutyrate depolymerase
MMRAREYARLHAREYARLRARLPFASVMLCAAALIALSACSARRNAPVAGDAADYRTLNQDGLTRRYVVRVPPAAPSTAGRTAARVPLVLVLHGGGGTALTAEKATGFTQKAMAKGFIVVYPEGTGRRRGALLTWNAGHCCGHAMTSNIDDVAFIRTLIDRIAVEYSVDPSRIYVTGMSNGGMMTHRIGIELADRVAAIATVVATVFGDERMPQRPVAAFMLNGMLDTSVPNQGGAPGGQFAGAWDGTPMKPANAQGTFWARANGCSSAPDQRDEGPDILYSYRCPAGRDVELRLIKDTGHAWPGGERGRGRGDAPGTSFNATDAIWNFFAAHPRITNNGEM